MNAKCLLTALANRILQSFYGVLEIVIICAVNLTKKGCAAAVCNIMNNNKLGRFQLGLGNDKEYAHVYILFCFREIYLQQWKVPQRYSCNL